jgi:hypothetical protein
MSRAESSAPDRAVRPWLSDSQGRRLRTSSLDVVSLVLSRLGKAVQGGPAKSCVHARPKSGQGQGGGGGGRRLVVRRCGESGMDGWGPAEAPVRSVNGGPHAMERVCGWPGVMKRLGSSTGYSFCFKRSISTTEVVVVKRPTPHDKVAADRIVVKNHTGGPLARTSKNFRAQGLGGGAVPRKRNSSPLQHSTWQAQIANQNAAAAAAALLSFLDVSDLKSVNTARRPPPAAQRGSPLAKTSREWPGCECDDGVMMGDGARDGWWWCWWWCWWCRWWRSVNQSPCGEGERGDGPPGPR